MTSDDPPESEPHSAGLRPVQKAVAETTGNGIELAGTASGSEPPGSIPSDHSPPLDDSRGAENNSVGNPLHIDPDSQPESTNDSARATEGQSAAESKGLLGAIARWWRGAPKSPSSEEASQKLQTPMRTPVAPKEKAPKGVQDRRDAMPAPASGARLASAETVHKLVELERIREEIAALKRKIEDERKTARVQLGQMELQCNELRASAEKARGERGDIEARTVVLRKSIMALERQLNEERESFNKEIAKIEAERDHLQEEHAALQKRVASLESELRSAVPASATQASSVGLATAAGAGSAHIFRLESLVQRLEEEVQNLQRQLAAEKEAAKKQAGEWQAKLSENEQLAGQARADRSRMEESAGMVQKAADSFEQQLRAERAMHETERAQDHARSAELKQKIKEMEAQLETARQSAGSGTEMDSTVTALETAITETRSYSMQVESRIEALENELAAAQSLALKNAQSAAESIKQIEGNREENRQQLLTREQELAELRPQVEELKKALEAARAASRGAEAPASAADRSLGLHDPTFSRPGVRLPADVAEPFYHQSMAPLTVMLACADIILMSKKLDPSLKSTASEVKSQTLILLDLIKSYTLPPEAKSN